MPYIDSTARKHLEQEIHPHTAGELNYAITLLLIDYVKSHGLNYQTIADCISASEGAKLEFYSQLARPYEDGKIRQNGDVYPSRSAPDNLAWAGGFFEGEGSFYAYKSRSRLDGTQAIRLQANLTQKDRSLLEEFLNVVGFGTIIGPNAKGIYTWRCWKNGEAERLLELLKPWLGTRRITTAQRILKQEQHDRSMKRSRGKPFEKKEL